MLCLPLCMQLAYKVAGYEHWIHLPGQFINSPSKFVGMAHLIFLTLSTLVPQLPQLIPLCGIVRNSIDPKFIQQPKYRTLFCLCVSTLCSQWLPFYVLGFAAYAALTNRAQLEEPAYQIFRDDTGRYRAALQIPFRPPKGAPMNFFVRYTLHLTRVNSLPALSPPLGIGVGPEVSSWLVWKNETVSFWTIFFGSHSIVHSVSQALPLEWKSSY